jgi:8-oxo-dGTP pyrophosphatase MutT (NUDIX family)
MPERIPTAGVLLYVGSTVLLVRHTELAKLPTGSYGFPAGGIEPNESSVETAVRELWEETGFITWPINLYKIVEKENTIKFKDGWHDGTIDIYLCTRYSGQRRRSKETIPELIEVEDVDKLPLLVSDDVIEIPRKYQKLYSARRALGT